MQNKDSWQGPLFELRDLYKVYIIRIIRKFGIIGRFTLTEKKLFDVLSENYNINIITIELIREGGCISYSVSGESCKFFMKVIPLAFMDTAKQSLSILKYLKEQEFPVPDIITTKDGLPYVELVELNVRSILVLYNYIEGREPDEGEDIETIGMLIGLLHKIMLGYKRELPEHGKEFFIDRYIDILRKKNYNGNKIEIFREYGDLLWTRVQNLPRGYCHGDMHRGNLLKTTDGKYFLLDFDTSCNAFPMYDVMIMCNSTDYFNFDEYGYLKSKIVYEAFLKGYTKFFSLSDMALNAFYDLIAIYHYQLQATIIEIYGLDCVDENFLDKQLDWLMKWREQCNSANNELV